MNTARAVLTLSTLESDLLVLALTLTVCVPIVTIVTTMAPAPPPRVATIRTTAAVHPVTIAALAAVHPVPIAVLAAVRAVAIIVLSRGVTQSQATEAENHQRTEHYRSLNCHIAPSSGSVP
jgi:hypothetical protein